MARHSLAFQITNGHEGSYSSGKGANKNDRGGETYCGIARNAWPKWQGWVIIDELKQKPGFPGTLSNNALLNTMVVTFFKQNFWDILCLDGVNDQRIANELYDTGVNFGTGVSALFLQRSLNVFNLGGKYYADLKIDGNVGATTIAALNKHPKPDNILKALNCLQGAKYISICEANPSQEDFVNGWFNRVDYKAA